MADELVSILIPVFNREQYIGECIESALRQTYRPIEVIVVDNASTDQTAKICEQAAASHPEIRFFRNATNLGPVRNWRRCIEEATGQFGKLLFSDDVLYPEFLERTVPAMRDAGVGFVFTAVEIGERPGSGSKTYVCQAAPSVTTTTEHMKWRVRDPDFSALPVSPGAALFRMSDLRVNLRSELVHSDLLGLAENGAGPDLLLYLLTAHKYPRVAHVSDVLTFFRSHSNSITQQATMERLKVPYRAALIDVLVDHWPESLLSKLIVQLWFREVKRQQRLVPLVESLRVYQLKFTPRPSWSAIIWFVSRYLVRLVKRT